MSTTLNDLEQFFSSKAQYEYNIMVYTFKRHDKDGYIENLDECNLSNETKHFFSILFGANYYYEHYRSLLISFEKNIRSKLNNTSDPKYKIMWLDEKINFINKITKNALSICTTYNTDYEEIIKSPELCLTVFSNTYMPILKAVIENPLTEIKSKYDMRSFYEKIVGSLEFLKNNNDDTIKENLEKMPKNTNSFYFIFLLYMIVELNNLLEKLKHFREDYLPKDKNNDIIRGLDCKLQKESILQLHFKMVEKGFIESEKTDFVNILSNEPIVYIKPIKWLINRQRGVGKSPANKTALFSFLSFLLNKKVSNENMKNANIFFVDINNKPIDISSRPKTDDIFNYGFEDFFEK